MASKTIEDLSNLGAETLSYLYVSGRTIDVMTTMNARELLWFFKLRTCDRAQWEIREIAIDMLKLLKADYVFIRRMREMKKAVYKVLFVFILCIMFFGKMDVNAQGKSSASIKVTMSKTKYVYDGKIHKPTVTVKKKNGTKIS
jgi:hypothetical protein